MTPHNSRLWGFLAHGSSVVGSFGLTPEGALALTRAWAWALALAEALAEAVAMSCLFVFDPRRGIGVGVGVDAGGGDGIGDGDGLFSSIIHGLLHEGQDVGVRMVRRKSVLVGLPRWNAQWAVR